MIVNDFNGAIRVTKKGIHCKSGELFPEPEVAKPAATGHETILLVEDEPMILKMVTAIFERQGYTVLPAVSPGEAIQLA